MAYKPELWAEAKKKCRLGEKEIQMAKELGLIPKSLIKIFRIPGNSGSFLCESGFMTCMKTGSEKRKRKSNVV